MMAKGEIVKTNPDPTLAVKEALELAVKNMDEKFDMRFKHIESATVLARTELGERLDAFGVTISERFLANEKLVDQLAKANAVALSAALQTQKESAAKSEVAMADLLKQLQVSFDTANKATNEKIDRLTSRLDTGEGSSAIRDPSVTVSLNKLTNSIEAMQESGNLNKGGDERQWQIWKLVGVLGSLMVVAVIVFQFLAKLH